MNKDSLAKANSPMALLWVLGMAAFLVNADNRAIAPVLPAIADDLIVRESVAGLLVSAYSIPYGLFQLFYGPIADRFGKTRTIFVALSCFSAGTIACSLVDNFATLFVLRTLNGIFAAGIIPVALAHIGDSFPLSERAGALSFLMSFSMSGQALGIVIGSLLAFFFSWKYLFVFIGIAAILASALFYRFNSASKVPVATSTMPLKERYLLIFANPHSRILYLVACFEGAFMFGGFTYLGLYANKHLGLDYFRVGLFAASFSIAAFIGSRFITPIIRKVGQTRMPFVGAALLSFSFALIWLIPNWIGLLAGFLVMGVGFSLIHTVLQTYATELLPAARGTCMSLFAFSFFLGNGIGPAFLGWIYEYFGPQGMFATTTVGLALFSVYCYFAFRRFTH